MVRVYFKNIKPSQLARDFIREKLRDAILKFPELSQHQLKAQLYADNTVKNPGPDVFGVKLQIFGKKFKNIILDKKGPNLYMAIAELSEVLLERLNRATDKVRVKNRQQLRQQKSAVYKEAS